uniref:Putative leucine-rich receptor-like protein n=1 Tax=Ipomoea batatas TaxID=4120 RepID=Q5MG90_IPOBA|nr:putative leucine-rich receptor-like protein [Ipomoea batatas]
MQEHLRMLSNFLHRYLNFDLLNIDFLARNNISIRVQSLYRVLTLRSMKMLRHMRQFDPYLRRDSWYDSIINKHCQCNEPDAPHDTRSRGQSPLRETINREP